MAKYLDLEGSLTVTLVDGQMLDVVTDYMGIAEMAGFDTLYINNLKRHPSPTMSFLEQWQGPAATVGRLWDFLLQLERYDVIEDCRRRILYDCEIFLQSQEIAEAAVEYANNSSVDKIMSKMVDEETVTVSIEDVKYRKKTLYHAFVSYTDEDPRDRDFVKTLIRELEFKRGLGLFVPGRNDLPGPARHTVAAYLIEKRCRRVIIVLSNSYTKSDACNFQMKFTHALSPDARKRKLIPVVRDSCVSIPNILNFISVCDFSKEDDVDWTWTRLFMALYSPIDDTANDQTDFNELENSLKDVPIPLWRPLSVSETERYCPERPACLPVMKPEELEVQTCPTHDSMTVPDQQRPAINHKDHTSNELYRPATEIVGC
ncbi:myeloid differentiation primary response protein MyD88-like [Dreissena polymorpha]|uniref:myeloid differentiation primary response protein MyD88-like n=1 Tax=Dreissena polymorpha TaxID=45954 RepID=UPI0022655577|nr:myeloid differentiation primary response protein MyD88-like [Dreissena polymorpha]